MLHNVHCFELRPVRQQSQATILCVSLFNAAPAFRAATVRIVSNAGQMIHEVIPRDKPVALKQEYWAIIKLANAVEFPSMHVVVEWMDVRVESPEVSELATLEKRGHWGDDLNWFYQDDRRRWFPQAQPMFAMDIKVVGRDSLPGLTRAELKLVKDGQRAFHDSIREAVHDLWTGDNRVSTNAPAPKHLPLHAPTANPDRVMSFEEILAQLVSRRNKRTGQVELHVPSPGL